VSDLLTHISAQLGLEEGVQQYLYDDATGKRFLQGMTLVGNLTIATGVNLMIGLDPEEIRWLTAHRLQKVLDALSAYAWFTMQDVVRQAAIADLAFNLGVPGLLHWPNFLSCVQVKDYAGAYKQVASNAVWIAQVKQARATRIENMILTGQWPQDIQVAA
jgi:lysozyme